MLVQGWEIYRVRVRFTEVCSVKQQMGDEPSIVVSKLNGELLERKGRNFTATLVLSKLSLLCIGLYLVALLGFSVTN